MTEIYLSPHVAGKLSHVLVHEGDTVKADQRVAVLDRFEQAERDYQRAQRLFTRGGVTQEHVEHADLALQDQQLISPINGIVLVRSGEPGEMVTPGVPALVIGDPSDVWIKVYFTEVEVGKIQIGQKANVYIDAFPNRAFGGHITFVSPRAEFTPKNIQTKEERATQMFAVKIRIDEPQGLVKPGLPADCEIMP